MLSISNPYKTILWNIETKLCNFIGVLVQLQCHQVQPIWQISYDKLRRIRRCELSFNEIEGWVPFFYNKNWNELLLYLIRENLVSPEIWLSNSWICAPILLPKILSLGVKKYEGQTDKINNPCFHKIFVSIMLELQFYYWRVYE